MVYVTTSFGARKCSGCCVSCTLLPDMFGPSPGHATIVSLSAAMSNSVQVPCVVFGLHTCVLVVVLAACLGFCELAHCHGKPWDETCHTRFLRPKSDAHRMYAQDQVVIHTVRM
jgi:hypothetical protein